MSLIHMKIFVLVAFAISLNSFGLERTWNDPVTGRGYLILEEKVNFWTAVTRCAARGMALSDLRYLSEDEKKNFLEKDNLNFLKWEERQNPLGGIDKTATLWQANYTAQLGIGNYGSNGVVLKLLNKNEKLFTTNGLTNVNVGSETAVCMTVPSFWYRCFVNLKCVYQNGASTSTTQYLFGDFGATQNEAIQRIVVRSQEAKWAVSEGKCSLATETTSCSEILYSN